MESVCEDCGARYQSEGDSCAIRFDQLLALDHSQKEPWGSRHGLAFAVFALQHPSQYGEATRARSLELLERVFLRNEPIHFVIKEFRSLGSDMTSGELPAKTGPFSYTIADCGSFEADDYVEQLDRWCRTTLSHFLQGIESA